MKKILNIICVSVMTLLYTSSCNKDVELYSGCKSGLFIQEIYSTDLYGNLFLIEILQVIRLRMPQRKLLPAR